MARTRNGGVHSSGLRAPMRGDRVTGAQEGDRRVGGRRLSRVLPRSARVRVAAIAGAILLLVVGVAVGAVSGDPSAEPTVQAFLLDWEGGRYLAAAAETTGDPQAVAGALAGFYQQVDADDLSLGLGPISQAGDAATARFSAIVNLGPGGAAWSYQGSFRLRKLAAGWKVLWSPAAIVPGLRPGLRLAVLSTVPPRAPLLDAAGKPLTQPSLVYVVGVRPRRLAHPAATAAALAKATGLDSGQLLGEIQVAPAGSFLELAWLKPGGYERISRKLARVPGLIIKKVRLRLFDSIAGAVTGGVGAETSPALRNAGVPYRPGTTIGLSGLQQAFQRTLVGSPTTEVVTENRAGKVVSVLQRWQGKAGTPVRTTINATVQEAADHAVGSLPAPAAIVAVRAATGQILAVADHAERGMPNLQPLTGHYQPGQAFTIVSAAAMLAGGVQLSTPIPCNSLSSVGGQTFTNAPSEPNLGVQPPFLTDFAHACRTAFAGLSLRLSATSLMTAAEKGFGLGASWQLPLAGAFAGTMRPPSGIAELAADSIGSGSVLISPLQAALMAAVVASGGLHSPSLVISQTDPPPAPKASFGTQVYQDLRTLMRASVASGAGRGAAVPGQAVFGQVGSAPLGTAQAGTWASWFVGFRGGVAFAVLEVTRSPSTAAASLAGQFLRGFPAGS
jgi:cell division protein FtsI/penicillin-binding protein 2